MNNDACPHKENEENYPPWITLEETQSTIVQVQLWPQGQIILRHLTLAGVGAWLAHLSAHGGAALRSVLLKGHWREVEGL